MKGVLLTRDSPSGPFRPFAGGDIGFQPDDRQDPARFGLAEEFDRAIKVAVIGQGQGGHAQRLGTIEQVRDFARTVQKAVMAVAMKMNKRPAGHRCVTCAVAAPALPAPPGRLPGCGSFPMARSRITPEE
jgi:hypothetical protein